MAMTEMNYDPAGAATDAQGRATRDPTENVLDLVEAAIKRQDDLREMGAEFTRREAEAESRHLRELMELRDNHTAEILNLRGQHTSEMRQAETERIDANRATDLGAVQAAAAVQQTTQNTLAATVASSAEALRARVEASARETAATLDAKIAPIASAIADVQRFQYESGGAKQQVVEARGAAADFAPVLDRLDQVVLAVSRANGAQAQVVEGRAQGMSTGMWIGVAVAAAFGLLGFMVAAAGLVINLAR
jgi:hypothetical protein